MHYFDTFGLYDEATCTTLAHQGPMVSPYALLETIELTCATSAFYLPKESICTTLLNMGFPYVLM